MMPLVAQAPRPSGGRLPEDGEVVQAGVAGRAFAVFDFAQHVFQLPDRFYLLVTALAQPDEQQGMRGLLLRGFMSL